MNCKYICDIELQNLFEDALWNIFRYICVSVYMLLNIFSFSVSFPIRNILYCWSWQMEWSQIWQTQERPSSTPPTCPCPSSSSAWATRISATCRCWMVMMEYSARLKENPSWGTLFSLCHSTTSNMWVIKHRNTVKPNNQKAFILLLLSCLSSRIAEMTRDVTKHPDISKILP